MFASSSEMKFDLTSNLVSDAPETTAYLCSGSGTRWGGLGCWGVGSKGLGLEERAERGSVGLNSYAVAMASKRGAFLNKLKANVPSE